jgi:hypothetical protein
MQRLLIATCLTLGLITGVSSAQVKTKKPQAVRIVDGPRVEGTGDTWAVIAWSTNVGGSTVVRYGTDANNLSQTAESPYARSGNVHRVRVKNLKPNTTYYFVVDSGQGSGTGTETKSQVAQFATKSAGTSAQTAPAAPRSTSAGTSANKAALPQSDVRHDDDDSATAQYGDNGNAKDKGKHKGKRKHHKHKAGERDQDHDNDHDQDDQPR